MYEFHLLLIFMETHVTGQNVYLTPNRSPAATILQNRENKWELKAKNVFTVTAMKRYEPSGVSGHQCGHTEQMATVNVCEAGSHEHAEGKQWGNHPMRVTSRMLDEVVFLAYLVCRWDARCGHRGSADSV